jgi:hypothetical protein
MEPATGTRAKAVLNIALPSGRRSWKVWRRQLSVGGAVHCTTISAKSHPRYDDPNDSQMETHR